MKQELKQHIESKNRTERCEAAMKELIDCTSYNCPVYNFRPVTASGKNEET